MKTQQQWHEHLASTRPSNYDLADMLALRDERIAEQAEMLKALMPPVTSAGPAWTGKVVLQYFRGAGRYYTEGTYQTPHTDIYQIFAEVHTKLANGDYPGLAGASPWMHVLVTVPGHPHEHPLLIPASRKEGE